MNGFWMPTARLLLAALLIGGSVAAPAQSDRNILWKIVSNCLGRDAALRGADCIAPRQSVPLAEMVFTSNAEATRACRRGTEVWGEVPDRYVVFRDIKMCACPDNRNFVHGLAVPYAKVPGVEAGNRPDGIWQFAWEVGMTRVGTGQKAMLSLSVNPVRQRSQDQLHVHIARLREDYLQRLQAHPDYVMREVRVRDLSRLWREAPLSEDRALRFKDFGVLVTSDGGDGYIVRITHPKISPEDEYTQYACPR